MNTNTNTANTEAITPDKSLIAAIEGDFSGMAKGDLVETCKMLTRGRARWHEEAEKAQDKADQLWLGAIAKRYNSTFGKPWDTKDGESREEGIESNISALFQIIEDRQAKLAAAEKCVEALRIQRRQRINAGLPETSHDRGADLDLAAYDAAKG